MPFQVIFSVYQKPPGEIERFSLGEDLFNVCGIQQTLVASIYGDINGHTFEWEQVIDDPFQQVTWLIPDYPSPAVIVEIEPNHYESSISYEFIGTVKKDKTFRFWIDKGTPFEQYDEIIVYATPASVCSINHMPVASSQSPLTTIFNVIPIETTGQPLTYIGPSFTVNDYAFEVPSSLCIIWSLPVTEQETYIGSALEVFNVITGEWDVLQVNTGNANRAFCGLLPNKNYRLKYLLQLDQLGQQNRKTYGINSNPLSIFDADANDNESYYVGNPLNLAQSPSHIMIPSYTITLFAMKSCIGELDPVQLYHGAASEEYLKIPTYTITLFTMKTYVCELDSVQLYHGAASEEYLKIPTYTVVNLGGGSIGGG